MLIVPLEEARPDMVLAAPVTHPQQPDVELLKAGYALEPAVIGRLRDLSIHSLYVQFPGLDELDKHLAPQLSPERRLIYEQVRQTVVASQTRTRPAVGFADYYAAVRDLILVLMRQGPHAVYMEQISRLGAGAVPHAAAVSHLSLLLAIKLENYLIEQRYRLPVHHAREVVNVGVAGMLHDVGKLRLDEDARHFDVVNAPEDEQDTQEYQSHARLGYEMLKGGVEASAANAVLNHHQRWDGTGFPATATATRKAEPLKQGKIHIFARILAATDLFDRLSLPSGPGAKPRGNLQVLHLMKTRYARWVDPAVLQMLKQVTPPFLPGMSVQLDNQTRAVVVDIDPKHPYRPLVKPMRSDGQGVVDCLLRLSEPGAPTVEKIGQTPVKHLILQSEPDETPADLDAATIRTLISDASDEHDLDMAG